MALALRETLTHAKKALSGQPPTVWIVRHGKTQWNSGQTSPERFRSVADIPLNEQGRREAEHDAVRLCQLGADHLYTSDLARARETADIISQRCDVTPEVEASLRPWDLGKLVGTKVSEGISTINEYAEKRPNTPIPGGESFNHWRETFLTALDKIFESTVRERSVSIVITHTRDLQLVKASAAAPGGLSNHAVNLSVFMDYSQEIGTGGDLKIVYRDGKWTIEEERR